MAEFGAPVYDDDDVKTVLGLSNTDMLDMDGHGYGELGWSEAIALGMAEIVSDYAPRRFLRGVSA